MVAHSCRHKQQAILHCGVYGKLRCSCLQPLFRIPALPATPCMRPTNSSCAHPQQLTSRGHACSCKDEGVKLVAAQARGHMQAWGLWAGLWGCCSCLVIRVAGWLPQGGKALARHAQACLCIRGGCLLQQPGLSGPEGRVCFSL